MPKNILSMLSRFFSVFGKRSKWQRLSRRIEVTQSSISRTSHRRHRKERTFILRSPRNYDSHQSRRAYHDAAIIKLNRRKQAPRVLYTSSENKTIFEIFLSDSKNIHKPLGFEWEILISDSECKEDENRFFA
jgi:hypothetical protein